jgi:Altronate dehydratase
MQKSFFGYRRDNGRVGIRNHVLILPLDDLSQPACNAVANNIGGTVAIQHPYGRLQFGADLDLHFRTLIGAGRNPNVAAVIVIGIEEKWTQDVVDGIAKTGKPVAGFGIEAATGQIDTIDPNLPQGEGVRANTLPPSKKWSAQSPTSGFPATAGNPTPTQGWPPADRQEPFNKL